MGSWRLTARFRGRGGGGGEVLRPGNVWQGWIPYMGLLSGLCVKRLMVMLDMSEMWLCAKDAFRYQGELTQEKGHVHFRQQSYMGRSYSRPLESQVMLLQALDAGHGASEVGASPDGRQPCFGLGFPFTIIQFLPFGMGRFTLSQCIWE